MCTEQMWWVSGSVLLCHNDGSSVPYKTIPNPVVVRQGFCTFMPAH